jgi:hypothetical protein
MISFSVISNPFISLSFKRYIGKKKKQLKKCGIYTKKGIKRLSRKAVTDMAKMLLIISKRLFDYLNILSLTNSQKQF